MPLFPPQDYRKTEFTHRRGLAANRPAAADVLVGTLYFSSDTLVLERSTGTVWESYTGASGSPGAMGPAGIPGFDGEDGLDGLDGINGAAGAAGIQGITGPAGAQGSPGIPGIDGEDGSDGLPGPAGAAGSPGIQGAAGAQGLQGPPGLDAEEPEYPYIIPGERGKTGPPGGGGGSATTIEVNLSVTPTWRGKFTITDAGISGASKILAWQAPGPYTGKGTRADEAELQPVSIIAVEPGAGSAVAYWQTPPYLTMKPGRGPTLGLTVPATVKDNNAYMGQIPTRLGKVQGNVKFTYMVM